MFRKMSVIYAVRPVRTFSSQQICDSHDQGSAEAGSGPVCHLQEPLVRLSVPRCLRYLNRTVMVVGKLRRFDGC
jgi:hypothetical protein